MAYLARALGESVLLLKKAAFIAYLSQSSPSLTLSFTSTYNTTICISVKLKKKLVDSYLNRPEL